MRPSNYPPNMDHDRVNPPQDDECTNCHEDIMVEEHWWTNGQKGDPTGDLVCESCGHREKDNPPFDTEIL